MKLNFNSYCFDSVVLVDDKPIEDSSIDMITAKLIAHIIKEHGHLDLFKNLMESFGNYEYNYCEQCGNTDTIISLEI